MRVDADRSKRWHVMYVYGAVAFVLGPVLLIYPATTEDFSVPALVAIWLGSTAASAALVGVDCIGWLRTTSRVRYEVTESHLVAYRRDRPVVEVPRRDIVDVEIVGLLDIRSCLVAVGPPIDWPYGLVTIQTHGPRRTIALPEIMIWGRDEVADAERRLRRALGLAKD